MNDAPILQGINRTDDLETADDFHLKHTPFIECQRVGDVCNVTVAAGHYVAHPNQADHWFEYIELYANEVPVARFEFAAAVVSPQVECALMLDAGTKLTAMANCNLHGVWAADITV